MCFFVRSMIMASCMWNLTAWGQQSPSAHREARTCKEAVHWSSRLKLQSEEYSKKRWSTEERKLQSQPEKKLGQPKNNIFYILNQSLSRKCRRQGSLLPQFLELE